MLRPEERWTKPLTVPLTLNSPLLLNLIPRMQAGIFLDCNKYCERVLLHTLEAFASESGYPTYALYAALDKYAGRRRILIQGAVSESVTATHGMPSGCGHA
eukprot:1442404-Amphidinium_carterae.1